jgi:hypothetical protein
MMFVEVHSWMFQHLSVLWLSRTHHLRQGFQEHISADLKYGKDCLIRLMVPCGCYVCITPRVLHLNLSIIWIISILIVEF